jgi:hypothetical protein
MSSSTLSYIKDIAYTKHEQTTTAQSSALLRLPPEIRNVIYRDVLVSKDRIETNDTLKAGRVIAPRMQLLQVCHQIRAEAYDIFWGENTFHFTAWDQEFANLWNWTMRIGQMRARLIKNFTIVSLTSGR